MQRAKNIKKLEPETTETRNNEQSMALKSFHNVYFIGIGGIGMSALARYFLHLGKRVAGYDKTRTPLVDELIGLGVSVCFEDGVHRIPSAYKNPAKSLVVYTPAIPYDHQQLAYFQERGYMVKKRSEVLGMATEGTTCLAVAGTHGKTTTSCILAHLLNVANTPFVAFLGGVSEDFNSNFVYRGNDCSVVEADEYDRSFLHLSPSLSCITSMDADHLEVYGTTDALHGSFAEFAQRLRPQGKLIVKYGLPITGITYGLEPNADYRPTQVSLENGTYRFTLNTPKGSVEGVEFSKPGTHNLLNAVAAFAMALELGCPADKLVRGLATFKGVVRRFSYQIKEKDFVFIDDYAHHPTEIEAVYQAVREAHPGLGATAVFQPHLYSRTRDFMDGFAKALSQFDHVILLDIYPARELPIKGVDSELLLEKINNKNKKKIEKSALVSELKTRRTGVLVTMGAGDIGLEVTKIKKALRHAS